MKYVVLDFETFYDPDNGYGLKTLSTPEYVGDSRFKVHCLGVEYDGQKKVLWGDAAIREWLKGWENYDGDYCFVFHNAYFDLAILVWHYGFTPKFVTDTLLLANHVLGSARDTGGSNALGALAIKLGFESKGKLDDISKGKLDLTDGEQAMMTEYLLTDLSLTRQVFDTLLPFVTNHEQEMYLLHHTLMMYATRPLILNNATVDRAEALIKVRREAAIARLRKAVEIPATATDAEISKVLASGKQFETALIEQLKRYGVPMPTKVRKTTAHEIKTWNKKRAAIAEANGNPPAGVIAEGDRAVAKWQRWADKIQAGAHLVPDELGPTKKVPAMSKQDEEFIRLSESPFEGIAALVKARLIEKSSDTSQSRLTKMRNVASGIGKMPVHLVYYGAHTGRWAGGGGFNFQNLTSPARATDPGQKEIAGAIREAFEAPEGWVFVGADASQIEARVSAWIAGQWDLLDRFARKEDVYSVFISDALGRTIRKPIKTDSPEVAQDMGLMRHVGKESVLGLGYAMGWKKFVLRLRANPDVAKKFYSGEFDNKFAKDIVEKYRELHPRITKTWDELNGAFMMALKGAVKRVGPVTFSRGKPIGSKLPVVNVLLPSGRTLYYRELRKESADNRDGFEWKHGGGQRIYGGLLLENITQAISRDIIVDTLLRSEFEYGMPIVLHVHDSIIGLAPADQGEAMLGKLIDSLRTNPSWAGKKLVLDGEGKTGKTLVT